MAINVYWHKHAQSDFFEIIDYFENEGLLQAATNFKSNVIGKISFIVKHPGAGRPTVRQKNVRYILVSKHHRMYYRHTAKKITLLAFFDARQHPDKNPF